MRGVRQQTLGDVGNPVGGQAPRPGNVGFAHFAVVDHDFSPGPKLPADPVTLPRERGVAGVGIDAQQNEDIVQVRVVFGPQLPHVGHRLLGVVRRRVGCHNGQSLEFNRGSHPEEPRSW